MYPFKTFSLGEMKKIIKNEHKAVGESILFTLFGKRYSIWVQSYLSATITPNFITIVGYVAMLTSYLLTFLCDKTLKDCPRILPLINFIASFIYITTDSVDGVHARNTNQCSPVGKVLDHFIDSNAVFYVVITLGSSLKLGISSTLFWLFVCMMSGFYMAVISEKFTGILKFSLISGATEGLYSASLIHLCAFICPSAVAIVKAYLLQYEAIFMIVACIYLTYLLLDFLYVVKTNTKQFEFGNVFISLSRLVLLILFFIPLYAFPSKFSLIYFLTFSQCFSLCCLEEYICMLTGTRTDSKTYYCSFVLLAFQGLAVPFPKSSSSGLSVQFVSTVFYIVRSWSVFKELSNRLGIVLLKMRK